MTEKITVAVLPAAWLNEDRIGPMWEDYVIVAQTVLKSGVSVDWTSATDTVTEAEGDQGRLEEAYGLALHGEVYRILGSPSWLGQVICWYVDGEEPDEQTNTPTGVPGLTLERLIARVARSTVKVQKVNGVWSVFANGALTWEL